MRKLLVSLLLGIALLVEAGSEVLAATAYFENPGQGIFECHADDKISPDYMKGGSIIVFWNKLQPENKNQLNQAEVDVLVNKLKAGKVHYLHFMVYGQNGQPSDVVMPTWLNVYDGDPGNDLIGTLNDGGIFPLPWDLRYQEKLGQFLNLLSGALEKAGVMNKIEYLEPAVGGMWGSTHLYISDNRLKVWAKAAGCGETDWACLGTKFTAGINAVTEKYLAAFPKKAVMMIGGSCKYGACNYTGFNSLVNKYGMRTMMKSAGLGAYEQNQCGIRSWLGDLCRGESAKTKCGQEQSGPSKATSGTKCAVGPCFDPSIGCGYYDTYMRSLREENISYYCLYGVEIGSQVIEGGRKIDDINREVAGKLGAQIYLLSANLSGNEKKIEENLKIDFKFANRGTAVLMAPLKQGIKWTVSSYKLFLEFVKDGAVSHYQEFTISPGTNTWVPTSFDSQEAFSINIGIPGTLGGTSQTSRVEYKIYAGLTDPNSEKERFAFRNTEAKNDLASRRYLIADPFIVLGQAAPTSTPTPTPKPTATLKPVTPTPTFIVEPTVVMPTKVPTVVPTGQPVITPTPWGGPTEMSSRCSCPNGVPQKSLGNANCDSRIDGVDFEIWREEIKGLRSTKKADFNCSGEVSSVDLGIWVRNRGR